VRTKPRRLPQLNALKAYEAAARHESFTRAAAELCVTQGAVSHQIKALEAEIGVKLFNRERQRLVITEAGRDYLNVVRDALDRIAVGTERLTPRQTSGALTVSTSLDFAAKWLVYRQGRLQTRIPRLVSASRRLCITSTLPRGCRPRRPSWRRPLAGTGCLSPVRGASLRGVQSETGLRTGPG